MKLNLTVKSVSRGAFFALLMIAGSGLSPINSVFASSTDGVAGRWKTIDDKTGKAKSYVNIWVHKGVMYGRITKLLKPPYPNPICKKCSGKYKNKPVTGMLIIWNMKKGSDAWEGGRILNPETGKIHKVKIWREGNTLKVRGYLGFLYRTQSWKR